MNKSHLVLAVAAAIGLSAAGPVTMPALFASTAYAQSVSVSFNVFFDQLNSGGRWVKHERYDYVWCPSVERTWAPYTHGHWVYLADRGWYFQSEEPFAWAVYHYGRWFRDTDLGWCWVPGNVWAPAWVSWRRGGDYIGWAPLQPESKGFVIGARVEAQEPPHDDWIFVPTRSFVQPQIQQVVVYAADKPDIFRDTRPLGTVTVHNDVVVNTVVNINVIQQVTNQKVEVVKAETVNDPAKAVQASAQSGTVAIFDAKLPPPKPDAAPPKAEDKAQAAAEIKSGQPAPGAQPGSTTTTDTTAGAAAGAAAGATTTQTNGQTPANGQTPPANGTATDTTKPGATPQSTTQPGSTTTTDTTKPDVSGKPGAEAKPGEAKPPKGEANCPDADKVNGVCPPKAKGPKGKPAAGDTTTPAAPTAQPATNNAPPAPAAKSTPETAAPSDAGASNRPAHKPGANAAGNGKPNSAVDCPDGRVVNGVCQPKGNNQHKPAADQGNAAQPGADTPKAPAAETSKPAPSEPAAKPGPTNEQNAKPQGGKPKAQAACPPGQQMVDGACVPAKRAGADAGGAQPQ